MLDALSTVGIGWPCTLCVFTLVVAQCRVILASPLASDFGIVGQTLAASSCRVFVCIFDTVYTMQIIRNTVNINDNI